MVREPPRSQVLKEPKKPSPLAGLLLSNPPPHSSLLTRLSVPATTVEALAKSSASISIKQFQTILFRYAKERSNHFKVNVAKIASATSSKAVKRPESIQTFGGTSSTRSNSVGSNMGNEVTNHPSHLLSNPRHFGKKIGGMGFKASSTGWKQKPTRCTSVSSFPGIEPIPNAPIAKEPDFNPMPFTLRFLEKRFLSSGTSHSTNFSFSLKELPLHMHLSIKQRIWSYTRSPHV